MRVLVTQVNGFINLYKPRHITSMEAVRRVKRLIGMRKGVGHTGTLDPLAEGVLPICIGQATRLMEHLIDSVKHYHMTVRLGVSTNTYDAEGTVVAERTVPNLTKQEIEPVLEKFRGTILQTPPMFSALKHEGKRLYELARGGLQVQRPPREVNVLRLELVELTLPNIVLDVQCGRGLYVRSLAHDIGEALGCGGHVQELVRKRAGPFNAEESVTLESLQKAVEDGTWLDLVKPADIALLQFKATVVPAEAESLLHQGRPISLGPANVYAAYLETYRIYNTKGVFVGLARYHKTEGLWHPFKIFRLGTPSPHAPKASR